MEVTVARAERVAVFMDSTLRDTLTGVKRQALFQSQLLRCDSVWQLRRQVTRAKRCAL